MSKAKFSYKHSGWKVTKPINLGSIVAGEDEFDVMPDVEDPRDEEEAAFDRAAANQCPVFVPEKEDEA